MHRLVQRDQISSLTSRGRRQAAAGRNSVCRNTAKIAHTGRTHPESVLVTNGGALFIFP